MIIQKDKLKVMIFATRVKMGNKAGSDALEQMKAFHIDIVALV